MKSVSRSSVHVAAHPSHASTHIAVRDRESGAPCERQAKHMSTCTRSTAICGWVAATQHCSAEERMGPRRRAGAARLRLAVNYGGPCRNVHLPIFCRKKHSIIDAIALAPQLLSFPAGGPRLSRSRDDRSWLAVPIRRLGRGAGGPAGTWDGWLQVRL